MRSPDILRRMLWTYVWRSWAVPRLQSETNSIDEDINLNSLYGKQGVPIWFAIQEKVKLIADIRELQLLRPLYVFRAKDIWELYSSNLYAKFNNLRKPWTHNIQLITSRI